MKNRTMLSKTNFFAALLEKYDISKIKQELIKYDKKLLRFYKSNLNINKTYSKYNH